MKNEGKKLSDLEKIGMKYKYMDKLFILDKPKKSTAKGKKMMVLASKTIDGETRVKLIHFGALGYEDYTVHKDENRRKKYHSRMQRFKSAYKYSPGYLSLVLLW